MPMTTGCLTAFLQGNVRCWGYIAYLSALRAIIDELLSSDWMCRQGFSALTSDDGCLQIKNGPHCCEPFSYFPGLEPNLQGRVITVVRLHTRG